MDSLECGVLTCMHVGSQVGITCSRVEIMSSKHRLLALDSSLRSESLTRNC
jgi:hypothetical protein